MSEENSSSSRDIDEEKIEDIMSGPVISLFIIKAQAGSLKQAEAFLKNRNWKVGSTTGMREALAYIIQNKPEFIMVPADHANKKIRTLPKLLQQAFPVKIIAYSESTAPAAMMSLRDMNQPYTLFPPASGPQIERIVLKIKKDIEAAAASSATDAKNAANIKDMASNIISVSGEKIDNSKQSFNVESAKAALNQLISLQNTTSENEDHNNNPSSDANVSKSMAYMPTHGNNPAAAANNPGYIPNPSDPKSANSAMQSGMGAGTAMGYMPQGQTGQNPNSGYVPGNASTNPNSSYNPNDGSAAGRGFYNPQTGQMQNTPQASSLDPNREQQEGESFADWEERMRKSLALGSETSQQQDDNAIPSNDFQNAKADIASGHGHDDTSPSGISADRESEGYTRAGQRNQDPDGTSAHKGPQIPIVESPYMKSKGRRLGLYVNGKKVEDPAANESIFVRGTSDALEKSVVLTTPPGKTTEELERSSNVACITVESERFSGYLVAAMGKNRKIDKQLINTIKERLFAFLKANGEPVKDDDSMGIKIKEVEFEDWAIEQAEFLRKSIHHGDEIAMAFFPNKEVQAKLEDSASEKMAMMKLDEIKGDVALEFDLYIYMPENNKYLLYTPQGMTFYGDQKSRLKEKGVNHMHLRKDSIADVKKYRAQNYLNEKIEAYKIAKKMKAGGS